MKNQELVNVFQTGLTDQMEELRTLVVSGVGVQQQQLQTLEEQLQSFLNSKDQVLYSGCKIICFVSTIKMYSFVVVTVIIDRLYSTNRPRKS